MRTIDTVMHQLTDAKTIMSDLTATLRVVDPTFAEEEKKFHRASVALINAAGNTGTAYLTVMEQAYAASVVFISWQGFQLNMEIFRNPVNSLILKMEYEDIHRERQLNSIPNVVLAHQQIATIVAQLSETQRELVGEISEFYSYLETTGYKLAHYFGYKLGNYFLSHIIPGYVQDDVLTICYEMRLHECLGFKVSELWP